MIKHIAEENLNDVIKEGLWIVDFYADWCGPCKMLGPVLETIDENILKVNVDNREDLATKFGVMSIPTLCFFQNGELKEKTIGFKSKSEIENIVKGLKK
ncbi:MAG: thioredoxin [Bacilli bacterium]|nr:thioredoxin [Bacilli bacterium]